MDNDTENQFDEDGFRIGAFDEDGHAMDPFEGDPFSRYE